MRIYQCSARPHADRLQYIKQNITSCVEVHPYLGDEPECIELLQRIGLDCWSIHTPLTEEHAMNLNEVMQEGFVEELEKTVLSAAKVADVYQHEVLVVIHNHWSFYDYGCARPVLDKLIEMFRAFRKKYPMVKYVVENVTPVRKDGTYCNGCSVQDIVKTVDLLNEELGEVCIGICIDLCHFLSSATFMRDGHLQTQYDTISSAIDEDTIDLYKSIATASSLLWELHVASAQGLSDTHEVHCVPVRYQDMPMIKKVDEVLKENKQSPIWTLEVSEDDYTMPRNAESSLYYVKKAIYGE